MRVLLMHRTLFTQYEHSNVTNIAKSGTTITITWTVGGNTNTQTYTSTDYVLFILAN